MKKKSVKNSLLKSILLKAKKLYTLGGYSEKLLRELNLSQQIDIVPPRIMLPSIKEKYKKAPGTGMTILSVGRLVKHKGHENFIRAAHELNKTDNYNFVIAGNGPEYNRLKKLCADLNMLNSASIKRNLTDGLLHKEFCRADIFALPSLETLKGTEGFGIVLLEAMAYRLPIVASASGGIPEVLDNGNCGILVKPGNVDELVNSIRYLSNNLSNAQNLAEKAYERLIHYYVWKQ